MKRSIIITITVLSLLLGCEAPNPPSIGLYPAIQQGDLDQLKRHIQAETDINQTDTMGKSPLLVAATQGELVMVRLLLKNGAKIDAEDNNGQTAIQLAVEAGRIKVADLLLKNGAQFNPNDSLHTIASTGNTDRDIIPFLIKNGAVIGDATEDGTTPLVKSIQRNHRVTVKHLIANGADVNQVVNGKPPLDWTGRQTDEAIIRLLERNGAHSGN